MSRKALLLLVFAVALVAVPALANEIIYFTNGTSMAIESYDLNEDGDTVRVNLGGQAFMEFPREQIERIEAASGHVTLSASGANRVVPGAAGGSPVSGQKRSSRAWGAPVGEQQPTNENIGTADNGLAVYRPWGKDAPPNKRQFGATGRREVQRAAGMRAPGGTRVGNTIALPGNQKGSPTKQQLIGLSADPNLKNKNKDK